MNAVPYDLDYMQPPIGLISAIFLVIVVAYFIKNDNSLIIVA